MRYQKLLRENGLQTQKFHFPIPDSIEISDAVWLDIECRKVKAPTSWVYNTRTQAFMVGMAYFETGHLTLEIITGEESRIMQRVTAVCQDRTIIFTASRGYDRRVLEGRWVQYRRGPAVVPGEWPHIGNLTWNNQAGEDKHNPNPERRSPQEVDWYTRAYDVPSKDVPAVWAKGDSEIVVLHNAKDLLTMLLVDKRAPTFLFPLEILQDSRASALAYLDRFAVPQE